MDGMYTAAMVDAGLSLATLAAKGTASAVTARVKAIKDEKIADKIRTTYDEIISELLSERAEAVRIAQTFKAELDRIEISDEDIEHLHNTVDRLLEFFKLMSPDKDVKSYEQVKEFIGMDTLKTMQLLGFNYKTAIGEPLTHLCSDAISSLGKKAITTRNK